MGHYGVVQVFRPIGQQADTGGIGTGWNNIAGTPGLLCDLSGVCYQVQWTDAMQGGLDKATFDCRMTYEGTYTQPNGTLVNVLADILFGNWIMWGCFGGAVAVTVGGGNSTVKVNNLWNQQSLSAGVKVADIQKGDLCLITDGVNSELFICGGTVHNGDGTWTIQFNPSWQNIMVRKECELAQSAAAGATSIVVTKQGNITAGGPIVIGSDGYTVGNGYGGGDHVPISTAGGLISSYPTGTPITVAGPGATTLYVEGGVGAVPFNAEIYIDSGISGVGESMVANAGSGDELLLSGPGLSNPHGAGAQVIFQGWGILQNSYIAGEAVVVRVQYTGEIASRIRSTQRPNQFSISAQGFFNRYNQLIDSSVVTEQDSAEQMRQDLASYGATLPEIIVNNSTPGTWLATPTGQKININETDVQFTEVIDTILRQENGSSIDVQFAVWLGQDRIVRHLPIATAKAYLDHKVGNYKYTTPSYYFTLSDMSFGSKNPTFGDTIGSVQNTDNDGTNIINAAIVTGTTPPNQTKVKNENTTTLAQQARINQTLVEMVSVPPTWLSGSGLYLVVDLGQKGLTSIAALESINGVSCTLGPNDSGHGSGWWNAGGTTYSVGSSVEIATKLTSGVSSGTTIHVGNAHAFSSGQEITLTPTGATEESLTIQSIDYGTGQITLTTAVKKTHSTNDLVVLANNGSGSGPRILVYNKNSIAYFGWREGTLYSEDISDETKLAQWAARQLQLTAWPVANAQVMLNNSPARLTGRDLVQIEGFADGSTLVQNVSTLQYNSTAADANVSATVNLGMLYSTAQGIIRQISKERARRYVYHLPGQQRGKNGVMHGHGISQTGDNQITIDSGSVKINGQVYQISAASFTVGEGESRWGVSVGPGVSSPAIVELPKVYWNGRFVYAHSTVYEITESGDVPTAVSTFTGLPLYKVKCRNGQIIGWSPLYAQKGVALTEMPSDSLPPSPTITGSPSVSANAQNNGIACDLQVVGVNLTNVPTDGSTHLVNVYVMSNFYSTWSKRLSLKLASLPQPQATQTVSFTLAGLPSDGVVSVGITYEGLNGESALPTTIITSFQLPYIGGPLGMILTSSSVPTGVGLSANPLGPGATAPTPGMLCIYTATGQGVNKKLYVYDDILGWQPYSVALT